MASDVEPHGLAQTALRLGEPHRTRRADLASESEIADMVNGAADVLGGLTVLVNCGAATQPGGTVLESTTEALDRALTVNTRAPFLTVRAALPHMLERGSGAIVNIASVQGLVAAAGFAPYAVSKIGLIQLTRQVTVEYGSAGIRCNAVCPGSTRATDEPADEPDLEPFRSAVGRIGSADEIADAVVFLASDRASFINGAIIPVDGGYTAR